MGATVSPDPRGQPSVCAGPLAAPTALCLHSGQTEAQEADRTIFPCEHLQGARCLPAARQAFLTRTCVLSALAPRNFTAHLGPPTATPRGPGQHRGPHGASGHTPSSPAWARARAGAPGAIAGPRAGMGPRGGTRHGTRRQLRRAGGEEPSRAGGEACAKPWDRRWLGSRALRAGGTARAPGGPLGGELGTGGRSQGGAHRGRFPAPCLPFSVSTVT